MANFLALQGKLEPQTLSKDLTKLCQAWSIRLLCTNVNSENLLVLLAEMQLLYSGAWESSWTGQSCDLS